MADNMADVMDTMQDTAGAIPSAKDKRYDRQLRLWGKNGQELLENAHLVLYNSQGGAMGAEVLKNLVLPGIGSFTIIDPNTVDEKDLGVNFFLDESCLGKSRAECIRDFVCELNPEVQGYFDTEWRKNSFHKPPTLIIVALPIPHLERQCIENYVEATKIPLVTVNSMGFYSYFRIQYSEDFPIVDTHPDASAMTDLGIMNPWTELLQFQHYLTKDMANLDDQKHGHIPYVIILLHYLEEWRMTHNAQVPETYAEKQEFKKIVQAGARGAGEENFDEAVAALMKTIKHKNEVPKELQSIFELAKGPHKEDLQPFWIITRAVSDFWRDYNRLPFAASVPDMKAESNVYVQLQSIYKNRARADAELVYHEAKTQPGFDNVSREMITDYCKNIPFLKVIRRSALWRDSPAEKAACLKIVEEERRNESYAECPIEGDERSKKPPLFWIFLALRAVSGHTDLDESKDEFKVSNAVSDDLSGHYDTHEPQTVRGLCQSDTFLQVCEEVVRTRGHELHNTVSLTGGLVSQEVIKLLTKQYVPVDNLCVYDGIYSRMGTYRLQEI